MAAFTKGYSPELVVVQAFGHIVGGYAENSLVQVSRDTKLCSDNVGTDGEVVVSLSADRRGSITVTLLQTSLSNDFFSARLAVMEALRSTSRGIVSVVDGNGTSLYYASEAWLDGQPSESGFGQTGVAVSREWVIRCANLRMFVGGTLL